MISMKVKPCKFGIFSHYMVLILLNLKKVQGMWIVINRNVMNNLKRLFLCVAILAKHHLKVLH